MINSGLFSKSTIFSLEESMIQIPEEIHPESNEVRVNKSILYHMIHSFIKAIYEDIQLTRQGKLKACSEFGHNMSTGFVEEESFGFVKYFVPKGDKPIKPFLPEMKLLNSRIWNGIFGSTSKLFIINNDTSSVSNSYKLDDQDFMLTKFLGAPEETRVKEYTSLVHQFVKGVIDGFLDKFYLNAEVVFFDLADNKISVEIKNINKKAKFQNF